jgi:hypothetical protein
MASERRKGGRGGWVPRWLRHRALVTGEAILLVGVVQQLIQERIGGLSLPNWGKVLWVMASTLGALGVALFAVRIIMVKGVAKAHDVVQAIPLPTPTLLIHFLVYGGLFLLYARVWDLPLW